MRDETFNGSGYSIERPDGQFLLVPDSAGDYLFDSFEELVEAYPICESARDFFFGPSLQPDPEHDTTGNGTESHYDLAHQLEMRGYRVDPDEEDNHHSYVRFGASDDVIADILGDEVATVANR
jgi:hypothetical protein